MLEVMFAGSLVIIIYLFLVSSAIEQILKGCHLLQFDFSKNLHHFGVTIFPVLNKKTPVVGGGIYDCGGSF